jgi:hypothetical protein
LPLHLAALITLTGSLCSADLESLCEVESDATKQRTWEIHELMTLLSRALPPFEGTFAADPIQPDVVGESFVLDILREDGHRPEAAVAQAARAASPVPSCARRFVWCRTSLLWLPPPK